MPVCFLLCMTVSMWWGTTKIEVLIFQPSSKCAENILSCTSSFVLRKLHLMLWMRALVCLVSLACTCKMMQRVIVRMWFSSLQPSNPGRIFRITRTVKDVSVLHTSSPCPCPHTWKKCFKAFIFYFYLLFCQCQIISVHLRKLWSFKNSINNKAGSFF